MKKTVEYRLKFEYDYGAYFDVAGYIEETIESVSDGEGYTMEYEQINPTNTLTKLEISQCREALIAFNEHSKSVTPLPQFADLHAEMISDDEKLIEKLTTMWNEIPDPENPGLKIVGNGSGLPIFGK